MERGDQLLTLNGQSFISVEAAREMLVSAAEDGARTGAAAALLDYSRANLSPWLTGKEAAAYLKISVVTLNRMRKSGAINSGRNGTIIRYHRDELDHLLQAKEA